MLKFRAWYGGDIALGKPHKFIQTVKYDEARFDMESDPEIGYPLSFVFADPEWIIEQYSGLTDKNDVEIYEGDILVTKYTGERGWGAEDAGTRYVARSRRTGQLELFQKSGEDFFHARGYQLSDTTKGRFTIVGNIHEHKELIS